MKKTVLYNVFGKCKVSKNHHFIESNILKIPIKSSHLFFQYQIHSYQQMNNTGEINAVDPIEHGHYYHIYNQCVGGRDIFCETTNYEYFLKLYDKYISPIAETCAWVLMKNHFHLLVRIQDLTGFGNLQELVADYLIIIKISL